MRRTEQGFLLLTSHLGDPNSKPLTITQFSKLCTLVLAADKPEEDQDRQLSAEDLIALGYGREMALRIVELLSRQELLEYYVNRAARTGCYPITRINRLYPNSCRNKLGLDSPGCLWAKGDITLLNQPAIALVGSRNLRQENAAFAKEVGRQAALQGYVLISGNARGADKQAQESCLAAGGQVISIVADSLENCVDTSGVLYLSEDGFDLPFSTIRALSRNRLIHSMGQLTLVAQLQLGTGGSWSGSVQNLRNGWTPIACFQDGSEASNQLVQMGANAVDIYDLQDLESLSKEMISLF